jgi:membrane-associated phospholipid phosphatase
MPNKARAVRALAKGSTATLLTSWALGRALQSEPVTRPSRRLYEYCREHRNATVSRRLDALTGIGDYAVIGSFAVLVGGMIAYERRDWRPLPLLVGGVAGEVCLQKALKRLVKGTKPKADSSIGPPGDFPSGGAARTVITFGTLARLLTEHWDAPAERRAIWSIVAALVLVQGSSRFYLGRHWPEDVVGGWLLGLLVLQTLGKVDGLISGGAAAKAG